MSPANVSPWLDDLLRIKDGRRRRKLRSPVINRVIPVLHDLAFWKGQRYGFIVFTRPSEREGYWWGKCMRCKSKVEKEYRLNRRTKLSSCGCFRRDRAKKLHKFQRVKKKR